MQEFGDLQIASRLGWPPRQQVARRKLVARIIDRGVVRCYRGAMGTNAKSSTNPYDVLLPIQKRFGSTCSSSEFYWAVNDAFHTAEAATYNDIHAGMFLGQKDIWSRLFGHLPQRPVSLLDIGSGTGLVGDYLNELAPAAVSALTLLDPNAAMLAQARKRSANWSATKMDVEFVQGTIDAVKGRRFDVITISSVMHHVVEIESFCADVVKLLAPGGSVFQMQDPRGDADADPVLQQRRRTVQNRRKPNAYLRARHKLRRLLQHLGYREADDPVANETSRTLVSLGIIDRPMDAVAIWSVTDFHVPGQMESFGKGFSVAQLKEWLAPLVSIDSFTYQYHATAWDYLSDDEKRLEDELWAANDQHGAIFGSAWQLQ